MWKPRYGKFRFSDYFGSWIGIVVLFSFAIASWILKLHYLFAIIPIIFALIWLLAIIIPNSEFFYISNNVITVKKGIKYHKIIIPSEVTIIVSYVDICPPLTMRTPVGNQTHILKDKFAVTLLNKMALESVLESLHRNYVRKYTTSIIKTNFEPYKYVYSFVCDSKMLDTMLQKTDYLLIIPESIHKLISINNNIDNIFIDKGF